MVKEIIRFKDVKKSFNGKVIFENLNFQIEKNKIVTLMAKSGYGKTTILRMIKGLDKDFLGDIEYEVAAWDIAILFQEDRLIEDISVYKNLYIVAKNVKEYKHNKKEIDKKIRDILKNFMLEDAIDKKVSELSGGMKKRVSMARCILTNKKVLLLDEPFNGLDVKAKEVVINYMKTNLKDRTIIVVLHSKDDAACLESEMIMLD